MLAFHLSKFIHLIAVAGLFGINLMSYALVLRALASQDAHRLTFSIKSSLIADLFMPLLIITLFVTGALLVNNTPYTFHTPWVYSTNILLIASLFFWFTSAMIKIYHFRRLTQHNVTTFLYSNLYHASNIIFFILLIIAMRDAITRQAFF